MEFLVRRYEPSRHGNQISVGQAVGSRVFHRRLGLRPNRRFLALQGRDGLKDQSSKRKVISYFIHLKDGVIAKVAELKDSAVQKFGDLKAKVTEKINKMKGARPSESGHAGG